MAKQFKRMNVTKHVGFYQDKQSGEEKKEYKAVGEIVVFSDNTLPQDLSVMLKMYDQCANGINPLSVWEPRENSQQQQSGGANFSG